MSTAPIAWPASGDFREALQNPDRSLKDPQLRGYEAEKSKLGLPKARSGQFANVYRMVKGTTAVAVRVFLYPNPEREERFRLVDEHLAKGRPKCLVMFAYQPEGIKVGGKSYPIQTMDWVKGQTLGVWLNEKAVNKEFALIRQFADRWIEMLEELQSFSLAHGDLQHGNVMVVNDAPVLVDYDCMCVPKLVGRASIERGVPAYQHPERGVQPVSLDMDHFSSWIILIALRAVVADPSLWQRYVLDTDNECLLFMESDILKPASSPLWKDLLASTDPEVRDWSQMLLAAIPKPFAQIPKFAIDPFGPLRKVCGGKDWEQISTLAGTLSGRGKAFPADIAPVVDEARRRVECRKALGAALNAKDFRRAATLYTPALLDDWPACAPLVAQARQAAEVVTLLDSLQAALKNPGDGRAVADLWRKHAARLAGVPEADALGRQATQWGERINTCDRFLDALKKGTSERAIADAWDQLQKCGGHPNADAQRPRAETARRRVDRLGMLAALPASATEESDRDFHKHWDDALFQGCAEADTFRPRQREATDRLALLAALEQAIANADAQRVGEDAVVAAAGRLPAGYCRRLAARTAAAGSRIKSSSALVNALAATPQLDVAIAESWKQAKSAGVAPTDPATADRCALAVRRRDCLKRLRAIDRALPAHEQDMVWLREWDEPLLQGCHDAAPLLARFEQARDRTRAWRELEQALKDQDATKVRGLARDPILDAYPPMLDQMRAITELIKVTDQIERVVLALKMNDSARLFEILDYQLLKDHEADFRPYRGLIEAWIDAEVLRKLPIKPSNPPVVVENDAIVKARWTWEQSRLISYCRVAADYAAFLERPEQAKQGTQRVSQMDNQRAGGAILAFEPGRRRLFVSVWPVAHLGWTELTGPPLRLGPASRKAGTEKMSSRDRSPWYRQLLQRLLNS